MTKSIKQKEHNHGTVDVSTCPVCNPEPSGDYFDTHHPCKRCKGYVPDGAIICQHDCGQTDP